MSVQQSDSESEEDVVRELPSPSGTNRRPKIKDSVKTNRSNHLADQKKLDKQLSKPLNTKRAESNSS